MANAASPTSAGSFARLEVWQDREVGFRDLLIRASWKELSMSVLRKVPGIVVLAVWCCGGLGTEGARRLVATEWPEFRGPRGDGHAVSKQLPETWNEQHHVRFKVKVPGLGWSTPVIHGDQVWLTTASPDGHDLRVICLDRNEGHKIHERVLFQIPTPEPRNQLNSYASPSPVIETGRVYVHFGTYGVACLDTATGVQVWARRDLLVDHQEGPGSSMVLYKKLLVCHYDGRDQQYVVALDKQTGRTVWRTERSIDMSSVGDFARKAFTTPTVVRGAGVDWLISPSAQGCYAYDPRNGRELWHVRYSGFSAVPRPVVRDDLAYVVTDFAKPHVLAVRLGGKGDITSTHLAWKHTRNGPSTPSPILVEDLLYTVSDRGILSCLDALRGDLVWRERLGGSFCASPVASGTRVYFCDREGRTTVIQSGRTFQRLALNKLQQGLMASPAAAGDELYLRTRDYLYCIDASSR